MAVDQVQEWQSDPSGRHRFRLYTDGRPTDWVSNGSDVIVDPLPPAQAHSGAAGPGAGPQPALAQSAPAASGEAAPITTPARPAGWYRSAANPEEVRYWDGSAWTAPPADPDGGAPPSNGRGDLGGAEPHVGSGDGHGDLDAEGRAATPGVPANWYPDPSDRTRLRYWDGLGWTEQVLDEHPSPRL